MNIIKFQKETSERSESSNWVLDELSLSSKYYFSGFEGCNEDDTREVTNIFDRACIEIDGPVDQLPSEDQLLSCVDKLEGTHKIGKLNFCRLLGVPYEYIFYNYSYHFVLRYEVTPTALIYRDKYDSFEAFSQWISSIKRWSSSKAYREFPDLPEFDKVLRRAGCPWPTNIDCIAFDSSNQPIALIEFQNAKNTGVLVHDNNDYFLPRYDPIENVSSPGPDLQRWLSQEILRVQSGLPHFTFVWSQREDTTVIKRLIKVSFPDYENRRNAPLYSLFLAKFNHYRMYYRKDPLFMQLYHKICGDYYSYSLSRVGNNILTVSACPSLSAKKDQRSFPYIYVNKSDPVRKQGVVAGFENALSNL